MKKKLTFFLLFVVNSLHLLHAQWTISGTNIYNSNTGNVGIGNTAPNQKLTVTGGIVLDKGNLNAGLLTANALTFGSNGTGLSVEGIFSKRTTGGNYKGLDLVTNGVSRLSISNAGAITLSNLAGTANRMVIASSVGLLSSQAIPVSSQWVTSGANIYYNVTNGNVGIGTTLPKRAKLELKGNVAYTTAMFGQDLKGISLTANNPGVYFNCYRNTGVTQTAAMQPGYSGMLVLDVNAGYFSFKTNTTATSADSTVTPTERMVILNNGNVGIGNAAPNEKLTVSGGIILDKGNLNGGVLTANALTFGTNGTAISTEGIYSKRTTSGNYKGLDLVTNNVSRLSISNGGLVTLSNLTGTGNRMVIASSTGLLSSQAIPVSSQWVTSGTNIYYNVTGGKVGIGVTAPVSTLAVAGNMNLDNGNTNAGTLAAGALTFGLNGTAISTEGIASKRTTGGNYKGVDIFTNNVSRLSISNAGIVTLANLAGTGTRMVVADAAGKLSTQAIPSGGGGTGTSQWTTSGTVIYYNTGNVGIGVAAPAYKLDVCGSVRAKEVRVQTAWCDYVFEENYPLRPLEEVKTFIQTNKHLPDVTSGQIIEKEGLDLGKGESEMIRKIEELTLYLIQEHETIKTLQQQLQAQQAQLEKLAAENKALKKD
ncbi:MAG: hypothetical protein ACKVTZ_13845 [Bacteroidia bacterium]